MPWYITFLWQHVSKTSNIWSPQLKKIRIINKSLRYESSTCIRVNESRLYNRYKRQTTYKEDMTSNKIKIFLKNCRFKSHLCIFNRSSQRWNRYRLPTGHRPVRYRSGFQTGQSAGRPVLTDLDRYRYRSSKIRTGSISDLSQSFIDWDQLQLISHLFLSKILNI